MIQISIHAAGLPQLIKTGSFSLYIIHGAFKSDWGHTLESKKVSKYLHSLFDHTSARRNDYENVTGSSNFSLSSCDTR